MKFLYEYRTSDNVRHTGEIKAPDREAAFVALKKQGIRPGRMVPAPGILNFFSGRYKYWFVIVLLVIGVVLLLTRSNSQVKAIEEAEQEIKDYKESSESPMPRHQIYGEPALMASLSRDSYKTIFNTKGDCYLAFFAQPGVPHPFKTVGWEQEVAEALKTIEENQIEFLEEDPREIRELKRIVLGMRHELKEYLSYKGGSELTYVRRLDERQKKEFQIYNLARMELMKESDLSKWEARNESLRAVGLKTIVPDEEK